MKLKVTESQIQIMIFDWASFQKGKYPELELMFHVPNGGSRHVLEAVNLKKQGVKSGVPDIVLPAPKGKYHGLYLELKATKKNKPSDNQKWWIEELNNQGYKAEVAYGFDEAIQVITSYLELI